MSSTVPLTSLLATSISFTDDWKSRLKVKGDGCLFSGQHNGSLAKQWKQPNLISRFAAMFAKPSTWREAKKVVFCFFFPLEVSSAADMKKELKKSSQIRNLRDERGGIKVTLHRAPEWPTLLIWLLMAYWSTTPVIAPPTPHPKKKRPCWRKLCVVSLAEHWQSCSFHSILPPVNQYCT